MTTPYQFTNAQLFTPTSINNCTLWLDAADRTTLTGTTVTSWTDKSGSGNTATSISGPSQSVYNNYPVVTFNGTSQFMISNNTIPRTTHTLIAVHRPAVINGNLQGNTSLFRYQAAGTPYIVFPYMAGLVPRGYITTADGAGAGSIDAGNSTLVENSVTTSLNLIIAVIQSGSQQIFRNGSLQSSTSLSLSGANSDTLTIGRYTPGLSEYYQGSLAEMIVYSSSLNANDRQQMEGYLSWKWGLQGSLPSNHPYKQTPPYRTQPFPLVPAIIRQTNQQLLPLPNTVNRYINKNWTPLNVANCQVWLDAADQATIQYSSGSNVSSWRDKSGVGNNASTSTNYPTYSQSSLNRLGTIRFNGASGTPKYLDMGPFNFGTNTRSFFLVIQNTAGATGIATIPHIFFPGSPFPGGSMSIAGWFAINIQGSSTQAEFFADRNRYYLFSYTLGPPTGIAADPEKLYANGSLVHSGTTSPYANATNGYRIGWLTNGDNTNNYYYDGNIAEFLIYNTFVTDFQRQQVEGYLAWKWGLQTQLPGNHPYKLFPPSPL